MFPVPLGQTTATSAKSDTNRAQDFLEATPTAELLPLEAGVQDDESENEMGMTYEGKYYFPYRQEHLLLYIMALTLDRTLRVWNPAQGGQAWPLVHVPTAAHTMGRPPWHDAAKSCGEGHAIL
jgi:hypothetical protein